MSWWSIFKEIVGGRMAVYWGALGLLLFVRDEFLPEQYHWPLVALIDRIPLWVWFVGAITILLHGSVRAIRKRDAEIAGLEDKLQPSLKFWPTHDGSRLSFWRGDRSGERLRIVVLNDGVATLSGVTASLVLTKPTTPVTSSLPLPLRIADGHQNDHGPVTLRQGVPAAFELLEIHPYAEDGWQWWPATRVELFYARSIFNEWSRTLEKRRYEFHVAVSADHHPTIIGVFEIDFPEDEPVKFSLLSGETVRDRTNDDDGAHDG